MLLKDWPHLRESRNGAGEMFWEVNRGGALILPGAQGLVFMAREVTTLRSRKPNPRLELHAEPGYQQGRSNRAEVAVERRGLGADLGNDCSHRNSPELMPLFV